MSVRPSVPVPPVSPAEMEQIVARAGLVLNPGQMADLVLVWRQLTVLAASIPRERVMSGHWAYTFRLPPPTPPPLRHGGKTSPHPLAKTRYTQAMKGPIPPFLTIAEAARLIAAKKLSPVELVRSLLARVEAIDPKVNAFLTVTGEQALAAARAAERGVRARRKSRLLGIPLAHKDIYETAGIRTTAHSRLLADHVPQTDAEAIRRLREAGAVTLGKLATHEFAIGGPSFDLPWPPARNPWDLRRFTGGSSSGSAAAIAAGLCLGSLASDTGGSIRVPASYCGVAGLKPTAGLVSRRGMIPLAPSLDTAGTMAWTAEDCALLLDAIAGYDPGDPGSVPGPKVSYARAISAPVKGLRVGCSGTFTSATSRPNPRCCA